MTQEITPLSVCLPSGSLEALRKKAKRIQRKFLTLDGQREKLSTVHDLVARCLGYRSYSDMHRWSDETRWPVLDEPEALRKGRQRMRELQCLSEAFPHVARDSVERLADQLALANWEVIEQSYHDKILGWNRRTLIRIRDHSAKGERRRTAAQASGCHPVRAIPRQICTFDFVCQYQSV